MLSRAIPEAIKGTEMLYGTLQLLVRKRVSKNGNSEIIVSEKTFREILNSALRSVEFDEAWYLEKNPDVKEAISKGSVKSGFDHFVHNGYFEGRLPRKVEFDESFYLKEYPDIASAVADKSIPSAEEHFFYVGRLEGRLPSSGFSIFKETATSPDEA